MVRAQMIPGYLYMELRYQRRLGTNKSDLSARIVKLSSNLTTMIEHYLNGSESTYDEEKCSKHLILVIFDSEWTVIQMMQLMLLIVYTNLSILLHYCFFVTYLVRRLKMINTCDTVSQSNRKIALGGEFSDC